MPVSTECAAALLSFRYPSYTSYLRRKSIMKRCFYHTELRQNAVFHNFSRQTSLIQYSVPSKQAWAFSETCSVNQIKSINQYSEPSNHAWTFSETRSKNFQNHLYGYRFSRLTSANFAVNIKRVTLQHNKEFILFIFYLMVL